MIRTNPLNLRSDQTAHVFCIYIISSLRPLLSLMSLFFYFVLLHCTVSSFNFPLSDIRGLSKVLLLLFARVFYKTGGYFPGTQLATGMLETEKVDSIPSFREMDTFYQQNFGSASFSEIKFVILNCIFHLTGTGDSNIAESEAVLYGFTRLVLP